MAGLLGNWLGENPFYQGLDERRNALGQFGIGLMSGKNLQEGLALGGAGAMAGRQQDNAAAQVKKQEADRLAAISATTEYLRNKGQTDPFAAEMVGLVEAGAILPNDAFSQYNARSLAGADAPSNVQEWQYYSQLSPEEKSQYLNMKRSNSPLNIGTGFVTPDQANPGAIIGAPIAINNEQEAFDKATGAGLGAANAENIVSYESMNSKLPGLRGVIDNLTRLADTATYTQSGQAMDAVKRELGLAVGQGAIDRTSYISIVDNQVLPLLRDTFGAAFTVQEGASLRATLGDANKSPAEKKAVLEAFISQKERDVAAMRSRIQGQGGGGDVDDILSGYGL